MTQPRLLNTCTTCHGAGARYGVPCPDCNGTGLPPVGYKSTVTPVAFSSPPPPPSAGLDPRCRGSWRGEQCWGFAGHTGSCYGRS